MVSFIIPAVEVYVAVKSIAYVTSLAKSTCAKKETRVKGPSWEAQVCNDPEAMDAKWKPFTEWKALYEPPPKPESERTKRLKRKALEKSTALVLSKLHQSISTKLVLIVLEVASRILEATEAELRIKATAGRLEIAPKAINTINGILLTFRFDDLKRPHKILYLRRVASDKLADMLDNWLDHDLDAAKTVADMKLAISEALEARGAEARDFLEERVQGLAAAAMDLEKKLQQKLEHKLRENTKKIAIAETSLETALETVGFSVDRPRLDLSKIDFSEQDRIRDILLDKLSGFVKEVVLGKMKNIKETLIRSIDYVLDTAVTIYEVKKSEISSEDLHVKIHDTAEEMYASLVNKISLEVEGVMNLSGGMILLGGEEDEHEHVVD